jgi:hypothetical protein
MDKPGLCHPNLLEDNLGASLWLLIHPNEVVSTTEAIESSTIRFFFM